MNKHIEILSEIFTGNRLSEIHSQINQLIKIALTTDNEQFDTVEQREKLLSFQETLTEIVDTAYEVAGR